MRLPTDPESVALIKALRPFLSEKGQSACDDLLGAVNLMSIFESLGEVVRGQRGRSGERPLAFLSNLAHMEIDPKIIAKAVDTMLNVPRGPIEPEPNTFAGIQATPMPSPPPAGSNSDAAPQIPPAPMPPGFKPEDIARMVQGLMARAAQDPAFAAMIGSIAQDGIRGNMLQKLMEMLGPDFMQGGSNDDRSR